MTQTVSVTLPGAALYVSGTVNGVETVWTNTEGYTWETVAARAADDTYIVELTIINASGISSQVALTLYYGVLTLITDRTAADKRKAEQLNAKGWAAMTAEEKEYYLSAANKGTYKALDFNRVNEAALYVQSRLADAGVTVALSLRTWADTDIPRASELETYRQNIIALRAALAVLPGTAEVPADIPSMTVQEANDIESILLSIDKALDNIAAVHRHCGVTICGLGGIRI